MAVDKNKIIAEATKHVQKGAFDKAIQAYQRILGADPKDVRILLKVAELQQKKGDVRAASEAFDRVAQSYAEQGFFLKSVAVYKQMVKLNPDDVRVNERLAELYQQLGLMSDAMGQFQFMATAYEKAGDGAKLTDVLQRMVELDPENVASSIKLGELHARAGRSGPAVECFRRAADYLKRQNRADEYLKVAERLATVSPDDLALTRELANIHLAKGDTKRALAKLQLCFKADPKDVDTLHMLAQAFRDLGQTSKTLSVYKELARVHEERGRRQDAQATWRKVQELAPDDEEAADALGGAAAAPPPRAAPAQVGLAPGAQRVAATRAPPPPARPAAAHATAHPADGPEAIPKLLTETDVYLKYGLAEKALGHLARVLAIDPGHAEALERARELHAGAGRVPDAARAGAEAVRALAGRGDLDRAREALARLRQLAPDWPGLADLVLAVGGTEEVELVGTEVEEEIVLSAGEVDEPQADDDALALAAAGAAEEEIVEDEPVGPARRARTPDLGSEDVVVEAARSSAEAEEIAEELPPPPRPGSRRAPPAPARPAAVRAPLARPAARLAPEPEPEPEEPADLADEIEEADFFVQQGLLDDAREALRNLLAFYPDHPVVRQKLAALDRKGAPGGDAESDASFDIARELAEMGDAVESPAAEEEFQYSVEDVFNQFKQGVQRTVKPEDSATHYDLGIAYKEMGLLEDAIHEFETALEGNDRKREVDCLSMIGLCQVAKGDGRAAVAAFRRALGSDHLTRDAAKAIHYELAAAHALEGDADAALYYFQRVVKADATFRDAARRVAELGGGPGRAPADERPRAAGVPRAPAPRPSAAAAPPKKNIGYL